MAEPSPRGFNSSAPAPSIAPPAADPAGQPNARASGSTLAPATWLRRRLALDVDGRRRTGTVVTQRNRAGGTAQLVVALESAEGLPAGHAIVDVPLDPPADLAADRHATVAAAGRAEAFFLVPA